MPCFLRLLPLLLICALVLSGACTDSPNQSAALTVVVDAEEPLRSRIDTLEVETRNERRTLKVGGQDGQTLPLSFALHGQGTEQRTVSLRAMSGQKELVTRSVRVKLVEGQRKGLLIYLRAACEGRACESGLTCGNCGQCEPDAVQTLVELAQDDDGTEAFAAPVCSHPGADAGVDGSPPGDAVDAGDGDGSTWMDASQPDASQPDASQLDASQLDASPIDGGSAADADAAEGGGGEAIPDASAEQLQLVAPNAVAAPKGVATGVLVKVSLPETTQLPVAITLSAEAGAVLAADCASPAPLSMATRELEFCLKHTRPDAIRSLPVKLTAVSGSAQATASVEFRMPARAMKGGIHFGCAVLEDGNLQCWGLANDYRVPNTENGYEDRQVFPFAAENDVPFSSLALAETFGCALTEQGGVYCWGNNSAGKLGRGSLDGFYADFKPVLGMSSGVVSLGVGFGHACAAHEGAVKCWGANDRDRLGPDVSSYAVAPVPVTMPSGYAIGVAAGLFHSCALIATSAGETQGTVYCWGDNGQGALGNDSNVSSATPVKATLFDGEKEVFASRIEAYSQWTCAEAEGRLYCWGYNGGGETGTGSDGRRPELVVLPGTLKDWQAGGPGGCAIVEEKLSGTATRRLYCWGSGKGAFASDREIALTPSLLANAPREPDGLGLGWGTTCVLQRGLPYCWGENTYGELGTQQGLADSAYPTLASRINAIDGVEGLSFGGNSSCLHTDAEVRCWGRGMFGALGTGTELETSPKRVRGLPSSGITQIDSSGHGHCALAQGALYCWGYKEGIFYSDSAVAMPAPSEKPARQLSLGGNSVCGLYGDAPAAELHCWWSTSQGDPTALASGNITAVSQFSDIGCAIVNEGVQCWGWGPAGALGNAAAGESSDVPVDVDGLAPNGPVKVKRIATRDRRNCVLTEEGDVWCWGEGLPAARVFPANANDKAIDVGGSGRNLCYVRSRGADANELWCEGANDRLQLSPNPGVNQISVLSFVRIDPKGQYLVPPIERVEAGHVGTICAKDQEGIKCWGNNYERQRGDGPEYFEKVPATVLPWMQ
jgi:alpha-tubulin suppressor-like RCC1 family protein